MHHTFLITIAKLLISPQSAWSLSVPPKEPRPSPSPEPSNAILLAIPITLITLCLLFILFRRASNLKTVVQHQLRTWTTRDGAIRLSTDEGPPARSFVDHDSDSDGEAIGIPVGAQRIQLVQGAEGGNTGTGQH